jgi:hypothetical protein
MNEKLVEQIASAVLYEGYMLYPYRPSAVKNRQRWNFGVVYPKTYSESQKGTDSWSMQTECVAEVGARAQLSIKVRFLQAVAREVGACKTALDQWPVDTRNAPEPDFTLVQTLEVGEQVLQTWQEAIEREIVVPSFPISGTGKLSQTTLFRFGGGREIEPVFDRDRRVAGVIIRRKEPIEVKLDVLTSRVAEGPLKISVRICNVTRTENSDGATREEALMQSLLSTHTVLGIEGGQFVSHIDPPVELKEIVAGCNNVGTWPVLAGDERQRDCMLSSPIILYDYPQIAPESPGDLFDGTEIDEILALRILTLTEDEKQEMRRSDDRSRQILERTEAMPAEHFMKLHGVLRGLRPAEEEKQ